MSYINQSANRAHLIGIYHNTQNAVENGYTTRNGQQYKLDPKRIDEMQRKTFVIDHAQIRPAQKPQAFQTKVRVYKEDTLDCAQNHGCTAVLNLANAHIPGGGVKNGCDAQEESLFRRMSLYKSLDLDYNKHLRRYLKGKYNIPQEGVIYSRDVAVIKNSNYEFCRPFSVSVVSAAAPNLGQIRKPQNYDAIMSNLARGILRTMAGYRHKRVTLGALGCGAFGNDPREVSKIFNKVLRENEFKGVFDEVAFAVLGDKNYTVFHKNLNGLQQ